ncbi:TonB-dependent receptor [Mucilaginibacter aquatilis]|uniref:TonB-dependent receptor plug domain-containing protein n=1 Tax=Mucilaginibacter aquatilis TaxID=1517760 RepID=A0A6I4I5K2_9SPHI|nr:TonB-dependent receptor [Mucilaginibacter aquatilis]MVN90400.1 TonB-dependent receptor plug domain-containing protein [Mucilaginibacter aquatilis]
MKNLFSAFVALLLPVIAAAQFSVSGKITNELTGKPLAGATVVLQSLQTKPSAVTGANGNYEFKELKAGDYVLKVSYVGYMAINKTFSLSGDANINIALAPADFIADEVTVIATRASAKSPTAFTNLKKADIQKNNLGQDLPYLLNQTPSVVTTSDAGAGVGYTGLRIRGSDGTRINVTVNGIPLNDAESQGSFFVNLPDFASSVNNIQIQRGVGTSTNGASAFGASLNIQTTTRQDSAYAEINTSAGSYGTVKNTVMAGTGLLNNHFSVDARLSRIASDGYIDRAASNLKSYYLSGAYYGKSTTVRANVFAGRERTYQAWNGIPDYIIGDPAYAASIGVKDVRRYNELGQISGDDYSKALFYKDQVDNYQQNHYQLLVDQILSSKLSFSGALHYTKGGGYYEEYKKDQDLKEGYAIEPVIVNGTAITNTDLARRLWLDNDFYGLTYSLNYRPETSTNLILGGAYNEYKGNHFGNVIYTAQTAGITPNFEYYRNDAKKTDFNIFTRGEWNVGKFLLYADMQYRRINYSFLGFDRNRDNVQQNAVMNFYNPKAGVTYNISSSSNVYASFSVGNHEPNRNDFTNSTPQSRPKSENLKDFEAGYRIAGKTFSAGVNGFYMLYKNQLVLTGALNDVGANIRTNVDDSYRAGVELDGRVNITQQLSWAANATLSTNKVKDYKQVLEAGKGVFVEQQYDKTDLPFSPSFIGGSEISFRPVKGAEIALLSKVVSRQYFDNTSNQNPVGYTIDPELAGNRFAANRYLNGYFVNDVRLSYNFAVKGVKNIGVTLLVNNIFSTKYESNAATYAGVSGNYVYNYNYFFPQAPRNFLASLSLRF